MNCYNHTDIQYVGTCTDCGKGLCVDCIDKYTIPICDTCNIQRLKAEKATIIKDWIITFIIACIGTYFIYKNKGEKDFSIFFIFYICIGVRYAWKLLTNIASKWVLTMSFGAWVIYYFMKLLLSVLIGIFIVPIQILLDIKRLFEVNKLEKFIITNNIK